MFDGKVGSFSSRVVQVVDHGHPPVIRTGLIKQNQGLWEPGTILTREAGELSPWEGTGDPVGVLVDHCDSTGQASANYLAHGQAVLAVLKKADGSAPTETEILSLAEAGIFGV